MARRSFAGGALSTTLVTGISNSDLTATIASATGWPDTSTGECVVTFERGLAGEEKALATRVGTTLTFASLAKRGVDGTTRVAHSAGITVEHTLSALDLDEANDHVNDSTGVHGLGASSSVVGTTDTQTLTNKTLTGGTLDTTSTLGGVSGTTLAAERTAWTTFVPVLTGATLAGSYSAAYKIMGKTLFIRAFITTTAGVSSFTFPLPASASCPVGSLQSLSAEGSSVAMTAQVSAAGVVSVNSPSSLSGFVICGSVEIA
jgi:hypothetical protein